MIRTTVNNSKGKELLCENLGNSKIAKWLKQNVKLDNSYGYSFNGRGYSHTMRVYELTLSQVREFNKIRREIEKTEKPRKIRTEDEINISWATRLVTFTGIEIEQAITIAKEKREAQQAQIEELEDRQLEHASRARQVIINQLIRSNPLRRIKDESHAHAILSASHRHHETNYDDMLIRGRELVKIGKIESAKDYARFHAS